jgi:NAD(P)H-hydrate epimerase
MAWESALLKDEAAEWDAMQHAGAAIVAAIEQDFREIGGLPDNARILVLAGKGHNGGDAMLAAKALLGEYPRATVDMLLCFGQATLRPLAMRSLDQLRRAAGQRVYEKTMAGLKSELASYDLCLDGVFGFQFRPPMDEATAEILAWMNTHPRIRLRAAVDLPSGIGEQNAGTVFRADFTYATGVLKSPLVAAGNAACVGRLRYLDLGFFAVQSPESNERVLTEQVLASLTTLRPSQSDKRTYGHLFVIGGSLSYPGAVVLAVRAALHSGVGLVTAFVPEKLVPEYAARHPEAMWVGCPVSSAGGHGSDTLARVRERMTRATALLIGPGLGADPGTITLVTQVVKEVSVPMVLDADALRPEVIVAVGNKPFIATPHAGEYQRIAAALSGASLGVVVQKGPLTRVLVGKTTYYSPFGGPVLARGGSGDILAGIIGGLLAQKPDDLAMAACRGVVWHGRAADLLARAHGQVSVETSQLLEQLGPALIPTT